MSPFHYKTQNNIMLYIFITYIILYILIYTEDYDTSFI